MNAIKSYGRNCPLVSNLINRVHSILMSDQDFFEILLTNRKGIKNYPIYVVEVFS